MKKVLSILTCLCMVFTALPMAVLAEVGRAAETPGEMVWSQDFQDISLGNLLGGTLPDGFTFARSNTVGQPAAEVVETVTGNRYLHYYTNNPQGTNFLQYMSIKVPEAAKDSDGFFTFEADIKLDPYVADKMSVYVPVSHTWKYTEYNIGLYSGDNPWGDAAYFTLNPQAATQTGDDGALSINGENERVPESKSTHKFPTGDGKSILRPYAWNTYRFVVRKTANNEYFADVYLNGWYFYRVGQRKSRDNFRYFTISMLFNEGIQYGGLSIDNARFYYGVTEEDGAHSAKGKFTVDNYDFNDLEVGTYSSDKNDEPILQGENVDHNVGALRRYADWDMNLDIKRGIGGKSSEDSSLTVSGNGRLNFDHQVSEGKNAAASTAAAYEGDGIDNKTADKLNTGSGFYFEQDGSDMTYFHSNYIANTILAYPLTTFDAKRGNSYIAEALINWKNPEKGDRIILTKGVDDTSYNDVYFSVDISKRAGYFPDPDKKYKYFMLSGDLMITDASVGGGLMMLRDRTDGTNQEFWIKMDKGAIYSHTNEKLSETLALNVYHHLECYVDLESHVYDVYLDGEMIGRELAVPQKVNVPSLYRCIMYQGQGSWILDNWEFRGMAKRYGRAVDENGKTVPVVIRSSQFADNDAIKEYLADKIVFHGDGQLYYKDGKKIPFTTEAVYENNELYIAPEDFNSAYGTSLRYDAAAGNYTDGNKNYEAASPITANGIELYPVKSLSIALGWGARHNGYGSMVIAGPDPVELIDTSDRDMPWFDSIYYNEGSLNSPTMRFTDAQEISNFVFYDRPDAKQIQDDFAKTMGENAQHPRLMITPDDVTRLRGLMETDGYFRNVAETLLTHVEENDMKRPLIYYGDSNGSQEMGGEDMRTLYQAFDFQNMERVACAYILTGDKKYADKAVSTMMNIVNTFPDLNPSHIIDLGSWLRTIALIYDWCNDAMTEEQRAATVEFIKEKGLAVINRAYYAQLPAGTAKDFNTFQSASWFPTWKSNYTSYTQGGVVMGALAVAEYCPDLSFDTLEKALRAYEYEHFGFYPGGIWLEGKSYQSVINKNNAYAFGSMQSCLGTDYKMLEYKGMHESLRAMMAYGSLTGSFTFADDNDRALLGGIDDSYQFYANYYDDPVLSMWRQLRLKNEYSAKYGIWGWDAEVLDMIYYEPMAGDSVLHNFDKASYFEGGEIFSVHENWLDKNAAFFASAGGPTLHYHRHYDAGDFYYAKDGVTWSYEFGQGDYNVGSIWSRFGGRSEAHNTITINNSSDVSMKESSFVPVIAQGEGEGGAYVVYDMKELYAHHGTEKMHRGFYIGDDYESLRIRDEMSFSKNVTGYWHFHTEADVKKIDDSTMLLTMDGKSVILHMNIEGDGFNTEFSVDRARPLPESPVLENDAQNKTDINQVRIKFQGKGDINITVEFYDVARDIDTTPISQWAPPEKTFTSTAYATALNEGETLEIASDVMFHSTDEALTLQATTSSKHGDDNVTIQVTPNYYGHGHWEADDFQNHRNEIVPGLPLGKWIRMKLLITRGTSETANKYSIYADNIPIVENADLAYWYTDESFVDGAGIKNPEMLTGNALASGFKNMYFHGNASYDNITFNRYLGGEQYKVDTQVPVILAKNNPTGTMPSIRGKVFAGDCSVAEILSQFGVDSDPAVAAYTVRDSGGKVVSDRSVPAGGNYIDILTTDGEHLYVTLAANSYRQNITDSGTGETGTLGDFALNGITAESIAAGYGRLADDKSIKLSNTSSGKKAAKYTVDSYDNNLIEFSFLPDADTDFRFGYDLLYVSMDGTDREGARQKNTGFKRSYPEILTISGGKVMGYTNPDCTPLEIGSYNVNEWTKVKLVFDHGRNNVVRVSVNDGETVECENGPGAYIYQLSNVYLTLPVGKNVIVDDIRIIDGIKPKIAAPAITGSEDEEVILREKSIIASDELIGGFAIDTFNDSLKKTPGTVKARFINGDGDIVGDSAGEDTIDKYVLINNDVYVYYTVDFYSFDGITVDKNGARVELINSNISDTDHAKLITAVYTSDKKLKTSSMTELTFTPDRNGIPVAVAVDYAEPVLSPGDSVVYYVWSMDTLSPLCNCLKQIK